MSSQKSEIPSHPIAKTIGPSRSTTTKPQQISTSKRRRRTDHRRPTSQSDSKSPQESSQNLHQLLVNHIWDLAFKPISPPRHSLSTKRALSSILFGVGEEVTDNLNGSLNKNGEGSGCIESYFDSIPAGYRFCPHDVELVVHYLKKKVMKERLPPNRINETNIYQYNPEQLAEKYDRHGEKEMYFFTPRHRKYPNGSRPNRAAGDGYWKATGVDKPIIFQGDVVGYKRELVFCKGRPPREDKTNWIMHEYRVKNSPPPCKISENDMRLDDWVLCRIYKHVHQSLKAHGDKNKPMNLDSENNVVADSKGFARAYTDCIDQLSQSLITETPQFSYNPLLSNMANGDDELFHTPNANHSTSMGMTESRSPFRYLTNDLVEDDTWSNLSYQANRNFHPNFDFFNDSLVNQFTTCENSEATDVPNGTDGRM